MYIAPSSDHELLKLNLPLIYSKEVLGCFLMSGVRMLYFLKDWWKFIQIHQYYIMALKSQVWWIQRLTHHLQLPPLLHSLAENTLVTMATCLKRTSTVWNAADWETNCGCVRGDYELSDNWRGNYDGIFGGTFWLESLDQVAVVCKSFWVTL